MGISQTGSGTVAAQGNTVSVIATVLNEAEDIGPMVESLMHQTLAPREVVIVDGGSTDGTWELLLSAARRHPLLRPVRDESCNRAHSAGPISRGRNVAIGLATGEIVACADAGCVYARNWLEHLTEPLRTGVAEYALGGACMSPVSATVWDLAAAPFFGVKLRADAATKSCTARSMAFRRGLWERVGGFPETMFIGEDVIFDGQVRALTAPAFVATAKAIYRPRFTLFSAAGQIWRYAVCDGALGVRGARFTRNAVRCLLEIVALVMLPYVVWLLVAAIVVELYCAFQLDGRDVLRLGPRVWAARILFSVMVPWIVTIGMIRGYVTRKVPGSGR